MNIVPPISIPHDRLEPLEKDSETNYIQVGTELDGEVMGYLVIFHQLHCLVSFGWFLNVSSSPDNCPLTLNQEYHTTVYISERV